MNMHTHAGRVPESAPPPRACGLLAFPLPNTPEARKAIGALRREARAEIERLLDFLDRTDGDHDLEDGGDAEPWLGWTDRGLTAGEANDDRELDDGDDEDNGDREDDDAERGMPL